MIQPKLIHAQIKCDDRVFLDRAKVKHFRVKNGKILI